MFGKKNRRNFVPALFLTVITGLFIIAVILTLSIPKQYDSYTQKYIEEVKEEVEQVITNETFEHDVVDLQNEYSFDVMLFDEELLLYTSNSLLYDIDYANEIYKEGFAYKGSYMYEDNLIWIVIYETNLSDFVNSMLLNNLLLFVIQTLLMIILLVIMLRKALKPLAKLVEIIKVLKNDSVTLESSEQLDEISEELVKVSNQLKLKLYYSKKEEKEYERRFAKQETLLLEQKNHLANVVHDVKGTFSAINFSSQCIANVKALNEDEQLALSSIESSSTAALDYITKSLNSIINNSYDIYVKKDEVNIKKNIKEFFEFNNMLLLEKSLKIKLDGEDKKILVNVLKFDQIINNILSNMIKYSENSSELQITIEDNKCIFINKIGNNKKEYSNSFGLKSIEELTKSIGYKYVFKMSDSQAIFTLFLGDDVNV